MGYRQEVRVDSPLVYMRLQERDQSNPTDLGSAGSSPTIVTTYTWGLPGPLRDEPRALRLDGSTGRIACTRQSMTANQTRLAWVRTTNTATGSSYAGDARLNVMGDSTAGVWDGFGVDGGKARFCRFNGTAWQTFDSTKSVADGRWHLIGATYDSSTRAVLIYVDGVQDGSGTVTAHSAFGGIDYVGRGQTADFYDGVLAEVEWHTVVLSPQRILARYLTARRSSGRRR